MLWIQTDFAGQVVEFPRSKDHQALRKWNVQELLRPGQELP
jgi:hypothetical protein